MRLTYVQKKKLSNIKKLSVYFSLVLFLINLIFSGFNLYSIVHSIVLSFVVGFAVVTIEGLLFTMFPVTLKFTASVVTKSVLYLFIIIILIIPLSYLLEELYWFVNVFQHHATPRHSIPTDWRNFFKEPIPFLRTIFIYLVGCTAIVFINQIDRILGPGVLLKLIRGKYHHPVEEVRIFMFLDLKSSTSIAEQLDNLIYSHFIRDIYFDIGEPIIKTRGEIYQYVGDEVVISWPVQGNSRQTAHCVECFFKIEGVLNRRKHYYESKYGFFPQFKAGLHYGPVIATMVGDIKRELVYHGDVMNTTARIQEQCNEMNQKLLLSEQLKDLLILPYGKKYLFLQRVLLKGKQQEVGLYTII